MTNKRSIPSKVAIVVLLSTAGIIAAIWVTFWLGSRTATWQSDDEFLKPGRRSFQLDHDSMFFGMTDEVDPNNSMSWEIHGPWNSVWIRFSVLPMYEHKVAGTSKVVAPRTIIFNFSYAFLIAILSAYPAWLWLKSPLGRLRRRVQGRNDNDPRCDCGYNLTGNESGKCPECGEQI
ncbi:MAG: hypothetical protein DHS20C16_06350 [Phycisphaerae bacterium]|nr:MAG: hypothetical protein DHS20C16_06350 [Phycisphaerae bacterium]